MLIDSHCHLDRINLDNYTCGLAGAVDAAKDRGVSQMLCVCISEDNKDDVLGIAERFGNIHASVGVHPSDVKHSAVDKDTLSSWAQHRKVVAIGETGLDYYYTRDFEEIQKESFVNHLHVAGQLGLPVIVHTRDAREDTIKLIREHGDIASAGVLHCFTESWEMARQALELNYYISVSGIVTFKNANELREVVRNVPLDRLLVETDSPYLAPVPYRGKPNEPKYVREVAEYVAELKGVNFEVLAEQTTQNYLKLFPKARIV